VRPARTGSLESSLHEGRTFGQVSKHRGHSQSRWISKSRQSGGPANLRGDYDISVDHFCSIALIMSTDLAQGTRSAIDEAFVIHVMASRNSVTGHENSEFGN
jgi:hypothetical protein